MSVLSDMRKDVMIVKDAYLRIRGGHGRDGRNFVDVEEATLVPSSPARVAPRVGSRHRLHFFFGTHTPTSLVPQQTTDEKTQNVMMVLSDQTSLVPWSTKRKNMVNRIFVRGCSGSGTTWFARVVTCLFAGASVVSEENKHNGCHIASHRDPLIMTKLAHPACHPPVCWHAVIARHPMDLKRGRPGAKQVWEAYYGAWARSNISNARFFRYEDVVRRGCTATKADYMRVHNYFRRIYTCTTVEDPVAWRVWNYTQRPDCDDSLAQSESIAPHRTDGFVGQ